MNIRGHATKAATVAIAALAAIGGATLTYQASLADPNNNELVIDGKTIATEVKAPAGSPFDTLYSGWRYRDPSTQNQQMDDFENPAFPLVDLGGELWNKVEGAAGKSCASCHNDASKSMKGVRAVMPKFSKKAGKPQSLEHYINNCRTDNMKADAWDWESNQMLGMTAYVGLQSRGMPIAVKTDGEYKDFYERGKKMYYTPVGQLDMSCSGCHENNSGKMIRADHLMLESRPRNAL